MVQLANFINNAHIQARAGGTLQFMEPATGKPLGTVPDSKPEDLDTAVAAAAAAFPAWSQESPEHRARLLLRLADLIDANLQRLASAESDNCGKPISLATQLDIPRSATNFRYFAHAVQHQAGEWHETRTPAAGAPLRAINYTLRRPRGVAGLISPWNLPLYLLTWKIAPALATGNTVVAKPSEVTPWTAAILGELALEAGLPPGVLNIVHGAGAGAGGSLVTHPNVPAISFTGSTAVGKWIGEHAGRMLKRVSLELGGKNAFMIFDDADLSRAIPEAVRAGFTNQGQVCLCGSRLLVHRAVFNTVVEAYTQHVRALRCGDPRDQQTQHGALTSLAHLEKVERLVGEARKLGGTFHTGGSRVPASQLPERCKGGYFFEPTVISGLSPTCTVEQEEIFGPVVTIQAFDTEDEAISLANGTNYGLAASVFTQDVNRAHRLAERIDAGVIWINCWMIRDLRTPFGGTKASGVGREGGTEAIRFFTEPRNICIKL